MVVAFFPTHTKIRGPYYEAACIIYGSFIVKVSNYWVSVLNEIYHPKALLACCLFMRLYA